MTSPRKQADSKPSAWESFVELGDDDRRELIDGTLVETEMPTELHERIVACLVFHFWGWTRSHGGATFPSGYRVRIDARHGFFPDVQLYHPKNKAQRTPQGCVAGAPDVVVEVLSEGSVAFDRKVKLLGYARLGVPEYWLVSQTEQSLERLVLRRGKYVVEEVLTAGDVLEPSRFPGLSIPITELFTLG